MGPRVLINGIWYKRLQIADRKSAMAFLVAKTVIETAKGGERDPQRLSERVIQVLKKPSL